MATDNTPKKVETPVEVVAVPVASSTGEGVAESYIAAELKKAKSALQRTMIVSVIAIVVVGGYLGYIATTFQQNLQPKVAAEIAASLIDQRVEEHGSALAEELQAKIPTLIADLPNYAKKELPNYRQALETQIINDLSTHCTEASEKLGNHLDGFLEENKDQIKDLLATGQDKAAVKDLGADLEKQFMEWLQESPDGGESITAKIDKSLAALKDIEKRMAKLAANKGLTPQEKKTRRAIAIVGKTVEREMVPIKAMADSAATESAKAIETTLPKIPIGGKQIAPAAKVD